MILTFVRHISNVTIYECADCLVPDLKQENNANYIRLFNIDISSPFMNIAFLPLVFCPIKHLDVMHR